MHLAEILFFVVMFFLILSPVYGEERNTLEKSTNAPFNVSEVIEKVTHHPIREGERIVIKDRVYTAYFDERGVVLKARETKGDAEDLVIPIIGKPEIRDGKVVYQTKYSEIAFEGTNCGLRYRQLMNHRHESRLHHYGNIAKLKNEKVTEWSRQGEFLIDTNVVYVPAPLYQGSPSVAFDGTNYLVVWQDERNAYSDIYGARVSQSGTVLDPSGIPISTAAYDQYSPSVAFDGTNYLVVWQDERSWSDDIYGARVSQSGTVLDPSGIPISTAAYYQESPSVAFDGTNYLVVWEDGRGSSYDIYGARVSQSGVVLDTSGIPISTATNNQWSPSVAFDGTNYLVVWEDKRSGSSSDSDIYGARVSQSGVVLDPSGILISTAAYYQESPSVAFDGTNYLVVRQGYRSGSWDIYGARVSQSGTVLDTVGIPISTATNSQWFPSVAFDGTNYLVVWTDGRSASSWDIYGARVSQSGTVLDTSGIPISTAAYGQYSPSVAFDGTNYLVVWQDERSGSDIYGARVSQSGVVLDTTGIAISTATNNQHSPSVAFDGTNYLVVWEDERNGSYYDIYGARVSQSGTVLDPSGILISTAAYYQESPSVAFDGTNYLVVWEDWRSGSWDIYGARVNPSGVVIDSFPVSEQPRNQLSPALAHGSGNQLLITYSGWVDYINGHPANTMRIWGKFYPFPGIQEGARGKIQEARLEVYPNPFRNAVSIKFQIPNQKVVSRQYSIVSNNGVASSQKSVVSIKIYDATGRLVKSFSLTTDYCVLGSIVWDGTDDLGRRLPSGVYLVRLETDGFKQIEKAILLR